LEYVYSPDYTKEYSISKSALRRTMRHVQKNKSRVNFFTLENNTPYLSTFYNWIVLDNLTLSRDKINRINNIFFGHESRRTWRGEMQANEEVYISKLTTDSNYDPSQKAWVSWIDLEITNPLSRNNTEYATSFELPEGCWISDYYLYVGERKEMGMLVEKKAAMWVYAQIRGVNKDPGLLYYLTGNKVAFRVFPFAAKEVRRTGIQFIHKEALSFDFDGKLVQLGIPKSSDNEIEESQNAIYIPSKAKNKLKKTQREPYLHFLVDCSKGQDPSLFQNTIESLDAQYGFGNTKVSMVSSGIQTHNLEKLNPAQFVSAKSESGFFLERAIEKTILDSYHKNDHSFPLIIVLSESMDKAVLKKDFSDLKTLYPDSDIFYHQNLAGQLSSHNLWSNPIAPEIKNLIEAPSKSVLEYPMEKKNIKYLADNSLPSIIMKDYIFDPKNEDLEKKSWKSGFQLQAQFNQEAIFPKYAHTSAWRSIVKRSFESQIMTPHTSFMVVENEAQKAMLERKQKETLSGKKDMDLGEEAQRMSEPGGVVLGVCLVLVMGFGVSRRRKIEWLRH